jgi:restriction endonuclease Mrr
MAIPVFQSLMLPLLKITSDGQEHSRSDVVRILADEFNLSDEDKSEMLPSGRQGRFDNRVAWAKPSNASTRITSAKSKSIAFETYYKFTVYNHR